MEAWYASAGRSEPAKLKFSEEVLIVAERQANPQGIKISGTGSYDVFRWDGTCVSVMSDEVSLRAVSSPEAATIHWKRLRENVRVALEKDRRIKNRNLRRRQECRSMGRSDERRCQWAEAALSRMVAQYIRNGGEVPSPDYL